MSKLEEILHHKYSEIESLPTVDTSLLKTSGFHLSAALKKKEFIIIAETKTHSPSTGQISQSRPIDIAKEYIKGKVDAISILTDNRYFGGNFADMQEVAKITTLPLLCKDFIVSKKQIDLANISGASAILLIVKAFKDKIFLSELYSYAESLKMDVLVEINSEAELDTALALNPKIIGVNSRNLDTLEIDTNLFETLLTKIPNSIYKLALSGISAKEQIKTLRQICNGVLIGTALSRLPVNQIANTLNEILDI